MAVTGDEEKVLLGEPGGRAIAALTGARPRRWLEAYRGTTGWVPSRLGCGEEGIAPAMVSPVTACFPMLLHFQLVMVPRTCVVMSQ